MAGPVVGEFGGVGYTLETTQGVYAAPTKWLAAETNTINPAADKVQKPVLTGTANAQRINTTGKIQYQGQFTWPLMPTNGAPLLKCVTGGNTGLAALSADTVKAATPVVTANGISTITLTNTGAVTYTLYGLIGIATGMGMELRNILSISGNGATGTVLTVSGLVGNAAAVPGTAVVQLGQIQFTQAATTNSLPTFSFESQEGNAFAEKYAGAFIEQFDVAAGKDVLACTASVYATKAPAHLASVTTPAPSAAEVADLTFPFTSLHTVATTVSDAAQTGDNVAPNGVSAQGRNIFITDVKISLKNTLAKFPTHDLSTAYRAARGMALCDVEYTVVNVSGRHSEFDDYLNAASNQTVPFVFMAANNQSNTSTATPRAWSFVAPQMKILDATDVRQVGQVLMSTIKGVAVPPSATGDAYQMYVVNADGSTAY